MYRRAFSDSALQPGATKRTLETAAGDGPALVGPAVPQTVARRGREEPLSRPMGAPVVAQPREEGRGQRHIAVQFAFGEHDQLHPIPPVRVTPSGSRTRSIRYSDESTNSSRTATAGEAIASIFTTTQAGCARSLPVGPTWSRRIRLWSWPPGDPRFVWPICSRSPT